MKYDRLAGSTFLLLGLLHIDRVGESVESALSSLTAIFSAHSVYFNNFRQKYRILTRRESYLIVLQQTIIMYAKNVRLASFFVTSPQSE